MAQTTSEKDCRNKVVMMKKMAGNEDTVHMVDQLRMKLEKNEELVVDFSVCEEELLSLQNVSI